MDLRISGKTYSLCRPALATLLCFGLFFHARSAAAGSVQAWGYNCCGQTNVPVGLTNVIAIDAGVGNHSLALLGDGTVVAWGIADQGQCEVPAGLTNVIAIAGGGYHSMALRADGQVVVWGAYYNGIEPFVPAYVPPDLSNVVAIAAGFAHNVALRSDGTVVTWGTASYTSEPPAGLSNVVAVAAGSMQNIALRQDGTVVTWGNVGGTLYDLPSGLSNVVAVSARYYNFAIKRADGTAMVWGSNNAGQNNLPGSLSNNIVKIEAGRGFLLAITDEGRVVVWGEDYFGRLNPPLFGPVAKSISGSQHGMVLLEDEPLSFVQQPDDITTLSGSEISLVAKVYGSRPVNYQWYREGQPVQFATNASFTFPLIFGTNNGNYVVVASNSFGSITSAPALVNVLEIAPFFLNEPVAQIGDWRATNMFQTAVYGSPPLTYQWRFNGTNISGATSTNYSIWITNLALAGNYSVVVSNQFGGATSSNALLTVVYSAPEITVQPPDQVGYLGRTNILAVDATGSAELRYQWKHDGNDLPGATNPVMAVGPISPNDAGDYFVVVSNEFGAVVSSNAHLAVPTVIAWGATTFGQNDPPAAATNVIALAAGSGHSLALRGDGNVVGWGNSTNGESIVPVLATNVVRIAAGSHHSLALRGDGTVVAWGDNCCGQTQVPLDATNLVEIAAGTNFSVGLRVGGTLVTWGAMATPSFSNLTAIAAGAGHVLALEADGHVSGWGSNDSGQITIPAAATNIVTVSAGEQHSLALSANGRVLAWGNNSLGQTNVPAAATNVIAIQAGRNHNLALRADGILFAWGSNVSGERIVPSIVSNVMALGAGAEHSAASVITSAGPPQWLGGSRPIALAAGKPVVLHANVLGWLPFSYQWQFNGTNLPGATNRSFVFGNAQAGQTGQYSVMVSNSSGAITAAVASVLIEPSAPFIVTPPAAQQRPLAGVATFGVQAAGTDPLAYQWQFSDLNLPNATNTTLTLSNLSLASGGDYRVIVANAVGITTSAVARLEITRAYLWGNTSSGKTNVPAAATNLVTMVAGYEHTLALRADGGVVAWGVNSSGQTNPPAAASNIVMIAAGFDHNLVLRNDGALVAWGNTANGKTTIPASATNQPVAAIAAGTSHNLVLRTNGSVFAWGINSFATTNVPARATNVVRIAAAHTLSIGGHNLALRRDGTVISWGYNTVGQTNPPVAATNLIAVAAGGDFSLALKADGTVVGWGGNSSGQITIPAAASNVVAIAAGSGHSLALRRDGSIVSWGNNGSGQRNLPAVVSNAISVSITAGNLHSGCLLGDGTPVFTDALGDLVAYSNQVFTLNALAVGAPPLSYQWRFNGVDLPAATGGTLTLASVQPTNAGSYSVVVSNALGVISGLVAKVSVEIAPELPAVVVPPQSQTVFVGTNVGFNISATGYPLPTYQWQLNGINIVGATNASYAIPYVVTNQAGNYRVVLSNTVGVITGATATLTVNLPDWPVFNSWPASRGISYGSPLALDVPALGAGPISYVWTRNGVPLPHVGGARLTFNAFAPTDGGVYQVFATNAAGGSASPEFELAAVPVVAWGNTTLTNLPVTLSNAVALGVGVAHAVALRANGELSAWGTNTVILFGFPNTTNTWGMATVPPGLSNVVAFSVGSYHNLAVRADGTVAGWGRHTSGETNIPATATNVIAVAAGGAHSLALRSDGTVVAWGSNSSGQTNVPTSATNVVAIAAGESFSVAVRADGQLVSWGNFSGSVATATNIMAVSARNTYTAAIRTDGSRYAAGSSVPSSTPFSSNLPFGLTTQNFGVAAGYQYTLYLNNFGNNLVGALSGGLSSTDVRLTAPTWLGNVVAVAAGDYSFALLQPEAGLPVIQTSQRHAHFGNPAVFTTHVEGRRVFNAVRPGNYQWRFNGLDIPGATNYCFVQPAVTAEHAGDYSVVLTDFNGAITSQVSTLSVSAPPLPQIASQPQSRTASAGTNLTFSLTLAYGIPGQIQWQFNEVDLPGATGSSLTIGNLQAANAGNYRAVITNYSGAITSQVATLTITEQAPLILTHPQSRGGIAGGSASFSGNASGTEPITYQWWFNATEIPSATNTTLLLPNLTALNVGSYQLVASNIIGSTTSSLATLSLSSVSLWGSDLNALTNVPASATNLLALATSGGHALALRKDGSVVAWGDNSCGQTTGPASASNVVRIATGEKHSLALRDDGSLLQWGYAWASQNVPNDLSNVVSMAAGLMHSIALRADGSVATWGQGIRGETNVPLGLSNVVAVAAGGFQSLALKRDGTLTAWGALDYTPPEATNVTAIAVGFGHAVALRADGSVIGWGSTATNPGMSLTISCGGFSISGSTLTNKTSLIPTPAHATNIIAITAGARHILALRADGELIAWGDNSENQTNLPASSGFNHIAAGGSHNLALTGAFAPELTTLRTNRTAGDGMAITLHTAAGGLPPLTWQWRKHETDPVGTNTSYLHFPNVSPNDTATYDFIVSNAHGAITGVVTLTTTSLPPAFVPQPTGIIVGLGDNITLNGNVRGSQPMTFQWRRDGTNLTDGGNLNGANTDVLTLTNAQFSDAGNYSLAATNHAGFAISSNATVTVFAESALATALDTTGLVWTTGGPSGWHWQTSITHDGVDAAETGPFPANQDETNWIETVVTGPVTVSFWWRAIGWVPDRISFGVDGIERIAVSNDFEWQRRSFAVPAGTHTLRWTYVCEPFAGTSTAWLDEVTLTNATPPTITTHPSSRSVTEGSSTTFSTATSGTEPFAYQWQFQGIDLPGATNAALGLSAVQASQAGSYQLIVTNLAGAATSQIAVLTVNASIPLIQNGPASLTAAPGTAPLLTSTILGSTPMAVQWQFNRTDLSLVNSNRLTLSNLQPTQAGLYRVIASNSIGTAISAEAEVAIVPVATWGSPISAQARVPATVGDVVAVAAGSSHSLALRRDGTVIQWGTLSASPLTFLNSDETLAALAGLGSHNIGLRPDGTVVVFNYIGNGLDAIPSGLSNVIAVATSGSHDLALKADGTVTAWGLNTSSQTDVPPGATNLVAIAAGNNFSLGITDEGALIGWGTNSHGQLDLPTGDFVVVAAASTHALALRGDGTVTAWGNNSFGQTDVPPGLSNIVAITSGSSHCLALRGDGKIFGWGLNTSGQTTIWDTLTNIIAIAGGSSHSLAVVGDGRPVITVPPQRRRLEPGSSTMLRVFATGAGPLYYQWQHQGTNIPGATSATFLASAPGNYSVNVSNALGTVTPPGTTVVPVTPVLRFDTSPGAMTLALDGLHLRLLGLSGRGPVVLLASPDFVAWTPILTNPPVVGGRSMVDATATNLTRRFYRAMEMALPLAPVLRFNSPGWLQTATGTIFHATLTGLAGSGPISILGSSNLNDWTAIGSNPPVTGEWLFQHLQTNSPALYWYRAAEQR